MFADNATPELSRRDADVAYRYDILLGVVNTGFYRSFCHYTF